MPDATILTFPSDHGRSIARRAIDQCARELREETAAEECVIAETVASYHLGRSVADDETAHLWSLADLLEESLDWSEEQRRAVVHVLHMEVARRMGRAGA